MAGKCQQPTAYHVKRINPHVDVSSKIERAAP
jgi:hypothetical protein